MKRTKLAVATLLLAAGAAGAEDAAQALTRGKLEADLGHQKAAADAFEKAWRTYGKDPEALRFLILAAGGALPGRERWEEVWKQVILETDRRVPERPEVRVVWPGIPFGLCPCSGNPVSLDFKDGDYQDIFRLFADISGLNVVVQPGVQGVVTYRANKEPWDQVLERLLAPNGLVARLEGNVLWIGPARDAGEKRTFAGAPVSFDYHDKDLIEAMREIAAHGGARVEVDEDVRGRVTFKLDRVPWDQAFDVLALVNGLGWTRTGDVIQVHPRRRPEQR